MDLGVARVVQLVFTAVLGPGLWFGEAGCAAGLDRAAGGHGGAETSLPESRPRPLRWRLSSSLQSLPAAAENAGPARPPPPSLRPAAPPMEEEEEVRMVRPARRGRSGLPGARKPGGLRGTRRRGECRSPGEMAPARLRPPPPPRTRRAPAQPTG